MATACASRLVGRDRELGRIKSIVDGSPASLLVLGDIGTGRSTLLELAAEHAAAGNRAVAALRGRPLEHDRPFTALHRLLRQLLSDARATGMKPPWAFEPTLDLPDDPALVRSAALSIVDAATSRSPLVVVIDDAHRLDQPSLDAIAFVQRHIGGRPLTVVLSAVGEATPPAVDATIPTMVLEPLPLDASARLLDSRPGAPTGLARRHILVRAQGNPLTLVELGALHAVGHDVYTSLPDRARLFLDEIGRLPEQTRALLTYAAAAHGRPRLAVIARAAGVKLRLADWAAAEQSGVVTIVAEHVVFTHPLARMAALHAATEEGMRRAHSDLADVTADDPGARAWHLAHAGADRAEAAAELEAAADLATGELLEATCAYVAAARRSDDPDERRRRYTKATTAAGRLGDPGWARELAAVLRATTDDRESLAVAACACARALSQLSHQHAAFAEVSPALAETPPRSLLMASLLAVAASIAFHSGDPAHRAAVSRLLHNVRTGPGHLSGDLVIYARAAIAPGRLPAESRRRIEYACRTSTSPTQLLALGTAAWHADESELAVELFQQGFANARTREQRGEFLDCFPAMISALIDTGRWREADAMIRYGQHVATVARADRLHVEVTALRALLTAYRGDGDAATALLDDVWHQVDLDDNRSVHALVLIAAGAAALTSGNPENAYLHLRALFDADGSPRHHFLSPRAIGQLAIAAWRSGRVDRAAPVLAAVRTCAGPRPTVRMTLLIHHAAALIDGDRTAEKHFRAALRLPVSQRWPLSRALAVMDMSEWLRKHHRPVEARPLLAEAVESFTRLEASALAFRARAHLRAAGVAGGPVATGDFSALTRQQQRVARLAADGLRNREIADRMHLSPRTVAQHLYATYAKLGITGRSGLRDVIPFDGAAGE
ncbi:helix-turn-helix transcriptional regulator [Kutzneria chonburiensis]|uniref:AAA family ATPase n=1 Tax=Kutzneria chonburiensis TaxID=1483604 RepID=A0ABV6MN66_9PSEU|nr:LuxR family transcriptional regulator [Kutzneria chonburiensis]